MTRIFKPAKYILEFWLPETRWHYTNRFNNLKKANERFNFLKEHGYNPKWLKNDEMCVSHENEQK